MAIVPIKGQFEGWRALLAHIMEDETVARLVVVTSCSDGSMKSAHFEMTREQMAYAALIIQKNALD